MKKLLGILTAAALAASSSLALAKDHYQVTGPVVDVKDNLIVVKKGSDNWEIQRDRDTKAGDIKKGDRVTIKYKMIATSVEAKDNKAAKSDKKAK